MSFCAKCGAYIPRGDNSCPACGFDPEEELAKAVENRMQGAVAMRAPSRSTHSEPIQFFWGDGTETTADQRIILGGNSIHWQKLLTRLLIAVSAAVIIFFGIKGNMYEFPSPMKYYCSDTETIYYYDGKNYETDEYEWWTWTKGDEDWELRCTFENQEVPSAVKKSRGEYSAYDLEEKLGFKVPEIYSSRAYKDVHFYEPWDGYYFYQGVMYYYLNDDYSEQFGKRDCSGWYRFDSENGEWTYVCSYSDKDALGEFWYTSDEHHLGSVKNALYVFFPEGVWTSESEFEHSSVYQEYEQAKRAHDIYWEELLKN